MLACWPEETRRCHCSRRNSSQALCIRPETPRSHPSAPSIYVRYLRWVGSAKLPNTLTTGTTTPLRTKAHHSKALVFYCSARRFKNSYAVPAAVACCGCAQESQKRGRCCSHKATGLNRARFQSLHAVVIHSFNRVQVKAGGVHALLCVWAVSVCIFM